VERAAKKQTQILAEHITDAFHCSVILIKDYYQILELPPQAKPEDIKKSFRKLAHRFHPDKNPEQPLSAAYYLEIQEAYNILSNPKSRARYDRERRVSGAFSLKSTKPITPQFLLEELQKLNQHLHRIDLFRMSHESLSDYILFVLSDAHLAILQNANKPDVNQKIISEALKAVSLLPYKYSRPLFQRLNSISYLEDAEATKEMLRKAEDLSRQQYRWARLKPILLIIITLILCFAMFLFNRKGTP